MPDIADLLAAEAERLQPTHTPAFSDLVQARRRRQRHKRAMAVFCVATVSGALVVALVSSQPDSRMVLAPAAPSSTVTPSVVGDGILTGSQAERIVASPTTAEAVRRARELGFDPQAFDLRTNQVVVAPSRQPADLWLSVYDGRVVFLLDSRYRDEADTPGRAITDADAHAFVGLTAAQAVGRGISESIHVRLLRINDTHLVATTALRLNRVNITLRDGVVVGVRRG